MATGDVGNIRESETRATRRASTRRVIADELFKVLVSGGDIDAEIEADRETIAFGQHDVEQDGVVVTVHRGIEARESVAANIDEEPGVTKLIRNRLRVGFVAFNY